MTVARELVRYYRRLRRFGLNDSHSGNLSVRQHGQIVITPSGACADTLQSFDLIQWPVNTAPPTGASRDANLHRAVYNNNSKAGAVMHSHGPHTVALTLGGDDFEPQDLEGRFYFPRVPVVEIAYEKYFEESPAKVAELLAEFPIMVVRGHGVYAWGEDLEQAYKWTCSLEQSAQTAYLARQAGTD